MRLFWTALLVLLFGAGAPAQPRGYLTTPLELAIIRDKAARGLQPYRGAAAQVLELAGRPWRFPLQEIVYCPSADEPAWIDDQGGVPILYAKALAFHLTGRIQWAEEVRIILERIMTGVREIRDSRKQQCQLNFSWGTPELVASADLIEDYWSEKRCTGSISPFSQDPRVGSGPCKQLFQNWLAKNPYTWVSPSYGMHNWGTAAAAAQGYIAEYLWDRPDIRLVHRNPRFRNGGKPYFFSPAEAYSFAKKTMLESMNGYTASFGSSRSCDLLEDGPDQDPSLGPPVKSQITETGIVAADARRRQKCNIRRYDGTYQNYPQLALDHLTAFCELLWRRGDSSCYDNVDWSDQPGFSYLDLKGRRRVTHLRPGRGSLERAINAIIVDSNTPWTRRGGLTVAYRYYLLHKQFPETDLTKWKQFVVAAEADCSQGICFGGLTHGLAPGEIPAPPPTVDPPLPDPHRVRRSSKERGSVQPGP